MKKGTKNLQEFQSPFTDQPLWNLGTNNQQHKPLKHRHSSKKGPKNQTLQTPWKKETIRKKPQLKKNMSKTTSKIIKGSLVRNFRSYEQLDSLVKW